MSNFDKISFFEKEYERELNEKDKFNSQTTNLITLLIVNITFFSYYITNTHLFEVFNFLDLSSYLFGICVLFYLILFFLTFMYLINFYSFNNKYEKIPYACDLNKYFDDLKEFNETDFDKEVESFLLKAYVDSASFNAKVNEGKKELIYEIRIFLFLQFLVLFLTFVPFYFLKSGNLDVYNVNLMNGDYNVNKKNNY